VEKYGGVKQATDHNIIRRMRVACWITKATECVTLIAFFTAIVATRTPSMLRYKYHASLVSVHAFLHFFFPFFYLFLLYIDILCFIYFLTGNINHIDIRVPILPDSVTVVRSAPEGHYASPVYLFWKQYRSSLAFGRTSFELWPTTFLDLHF
jgi:hypothetical protein